MAQLITSDIPRFWEAFRFIHAPDAEAHMQRLYLDAGTAGVQGFRPGRIESAAHLVRVARAREAFYSGIQASSLQVMVQVMGDVAPQLDSVLEGFERLFPGVVLPDIYLVIGAMNSGGTMAHGPDGPIAIIGLEFFSAAPDTPMHELTPWERGVIQPPTQLPAIIAHELVHTLQDIPDESQRSLLLYTLAEGAADYLGELVSGQTVNPALHRYGLEHENELKAEFLRDILRGQSHEAWMYQGQKAAGHPADLGYFIGAQIVRAYHRKFAHHPAVLRDLLHFSLRVPEEFTRRSGYFGEAWLARGLHV